ncbi:uncharacterized protein LOC135846084 [Planococcus citri]|uniref:uncharacterized protein LOC135834316 n=1 Tax=Planococcus citri TaxID=170843 RepID=UPI0031F7521A
MASNNSSTSTSTSSSSSSSLTMTNNPVEYRFTASCPDFVAQDIIYILENIFDESSWMNVKIEEKGEHTVEFTIPFPVKLQTVIKKVTEAGFENLSINTINVSEVSRKRFLELKTLQQKKRKLMNRMLIREGGEEEVNDGN